MLGKTATWFHGVEIPKPEVRPVGQEFPPPARTVSFKARDGVKLAAWDIPAAHSTNGVAILFHGYAVSRSSLLGEARVLHEMGWETLLVDFRGSGESDGSVTTLGWREAADVVAATDWSRHEWPASRMVLYGSSMGAAAVLRAIAHDGVKPDGVILEAPFDLFLTTIEHRFEAMNLPPFPLARLLVFWGGVQHGFNAFRHNPVEYARAVRCPSLVLDGERDPWVKPEEAKRVANAMGGPTQCHIFANGGHCGYWWDAADEYRTTVGAWLPTLTANQKNGNGK